MADEKDDKGPYKRYQAELGPPWVQAPRGRAWHEGIGAGKDQLCLWCAAAVRARLIPTTDEQSLAYLGAERQLERAPAEYTDAYRARVQGAWEFWLRGGTRPGMLAALRQLGYSAVLIEHGHGPPEGQVPPDRVWWSEFTIFLLPGEDVRWGSVPWDSAGVAWDQADLRWDTTITTVELARIARVICQMKSAHSRPRRVAYAEDMVFWDAVGIEWDETPPHQWDGSGAVIEIPFAPGRICRAA